jgi:hypothetical protein
MTDLTDTIKVRRIDPDYPEHADLVTRLRSFETNELMFSSDRLARAGVCAEAAMRSPPNGTKSRSSCGRRKSCVMGASWD